MGVSTKILTVLFVLLCTAGLLYGQNLIDFSQVNEHLQKGDDLKMKCNFKFEKTKDLVDFHFLKEDENGTKVIANCNMATRGCYDLRHNCANPELRCVGDGPPHQNSMMNNYRLLIIKDVQEKDLGTYLCEVEGVDRYDPMTSLVESVVRQKSMEVKFGQRSGASRNCKGFSETMHYLLILLLSQMVYQML